MKKIALLQKKELTEQIFTNEVISCLRNYGEVVINPKNDDVDTDDIKKVIKNADIAVTSWGCPLLTEDILKEAPNLKLIIHAAGSVKGIVSEKIWEKGIRVSSCAEAIGMGVAETAVGLTIISLKNIWNLSQYTKEGEWEKGREQVKELTDIVIGVIGAGKVGQYYIKLMKNFDVRILLFDPIIEDENAVKLGVEKVSFEEVLKYSDLISIHAPSIKETNNMFNKNTLSMMKDDAILINTARGSIINENDLINELKNGRLFACLDVTDPEPPAVSHPFRSLPNVILTPHIAGTVNNGLHRISKYALNEIELFEKGKKMNGEVTKKMLEFIA